MLRRVPSGFRTPDPLIHNRRISLVLADARIVLTYNRIGSWKHRNASREFGLNLAQIR
jgi:hypothetical protein